MIAEPIVEADAQGTRARIVEAASKLISEGGIAALTTRAVAAAAMVQPPTLYRLFGEKRGLLNAIAEHGLAEFIARKVATEPHVDPVQDLSDAWDAYVEFGLTNPAVFAIMNEVGAPHESPAMLAGIAVLRARVERLARAGRLRMTVERAVALVHAVGVGTVTTLLGVPGEMRDPHLATAAREAVFAAILIDHPSQQVSSVSTLAVGLHAHLGEADALTPGEKLLLAELLLRLAAPSSADRSGRKADQSN